MGIIKIHLLARASDSATRAAPAVRHRPLVAVSIPRKREGGFGGLVEQCGGWVAGLWFGFGDHDGGSVDPGGVVVAGEVDAAIGGQLAGQLRDISGAVAVRELVQRLGRRRVGHLRPGQGDEHLVVLIVVRVEQDAEQ